MLYVGAQHARRTPPWELSDAAQMWARDTGRRFGRMEWNPFVECWVIHFGRKATDPVRRAWQENQLEEEPTESIMLHEWDKQKNRYVPIPLEDLGASGLRELLDAASLTSGRGEHKSLQEAVTKVRENNNRVREKNRKLAREAGEEIDWLFGRQLRGAAFSTVGIDLKPTSNP